MGAGCAKLCPADSVFGHALQKLNKAKQEATRLVGGDDNFFGKSHAHHEYVYAEHPGTGLKMRAQVLNDYEVTKKTEDEDDFLLPLSALGGVLTTGLGQLAHLADTPKLVMWGTFCKPERGTLEVVSVTHPAKVPRNNHLSFCQVVGDPVLSYSVGTHLMFFDTTTSVWSQATIGAVEEGYYLINKEDETFEFVNKNSKRIRAETAAEALARHKAEKKERHLEHQRAIAAGQEVSSRSSEEDSTLMQETVLDEEGEENLCWDALKIRHYVRAISKDKTSWIPARIVKKTKHELYVRYYDMSYQLQDDLSSNLLLQDSHTAAYTSQVTGTVTFWNAQTGEGEIVLDKADSRFPRHVALQAEDVLGRKVGELFSPCLTVVVTPVVLRAASKKERAFDPTHFVKPIKQAVTETFRQFGPIVKCQVFCYIKEKDGPVEKDNEVMHSAYDWFAQVTFENQYTNAWAPAYNAVQAGGAKISFEYAQKLKSIPVRADFAVTSQEEKQARRVSFTVVLGEGSTGYRAKDVIRLSDLSSPFLRVERANKKDLNKTIILDYDRPQHHQKFHAMYNYVRKFHERHMSIKFIPAEDSDSLYQAVSHQLFGTTSNSAFVKRKCVEHLRRHSEYFSQFVDIDYEYYLSRKAQDNEPSLGDHLDIQAICEIYDVQAEIYYEPGAFLKPTDVDFREYDVIKKTWALESEEGSSVEVTTEDDSEDSEPSLVEISSLSSSKEEKPQELMGSDYESEASTVSSDDSNDEVRTLQKHKKSRLESSRDKAKINRQKTMMASAERKKYLKAEKEKLKANARDLERNKKLAKLNSRRLHLPEVFFYTDLGLPHTLRFSYNGGGHYDSVYKVYEALPLPVVGKNVEGKVLAARKEECQLQAQEGQYDELQKEKAEMGLHEEASKSAAARCAGLFKHCFQAARSCCSASLRVLHLANTTPQNQMILSHYIGEVRLRAEKGQETALFLKLLSKAGIKPLPNMEGWTPYTDDKSKAREFLVEGKLIITYPFFWPDYKRTKEQIKKLKMVEADNKQRLVEREARRAKQLKARLDAAMAVSEQKYNEVKAMLDRRQREMDRKEEDKRRSRSQCLMSIAGFDDEVQRVVNLIRRNSDPCYLQHDFVGSMVPSLD
mmetsp:Transcript_37169/g.73007  ORF Transcript_37169/g.73007 Transcript_37169/m.73007 type:complete len:1124 (-) Transcript_37169:89-3460(-)